MINSIPVLADSMQGFDISHIHNQHWKDFCDVCYPRFGFEAGEERSYEQKYETFCRCKLYVTEEKDYEQQLTKTKEEDIERLKQQIEIFYNLRDARDMIPSLYALVSICKTITDNIRSDIELVRYVCPRKSLLHFDNLHVKTPLDYYDNALNDTKIDDVTDPIMRQIMNLVDIPPYVNGYSVSEGTKKCARRHISLYEAALQDLESLSPSNNKCAKGSELKAFLFRLFMSYEDSLPDIKEQLEELPSPMNLQELKNEGVKLLSEFLNSSLGERWVTCMKLDDGLKHFASYFMHHRKNFTEEDEQIFFYTLDKICIIDDILQGNAEKYWLNMQYPDGWVQNNENSIERYIQLDLTNSVLEAGKFCKIAGNNSTFNLTYVKGDLVAHKDANIDKNFGPIVTTE